MCAELAFAFATLASSAFRFIPVGCRMVGRKMRGLRDMLSFVTLGLNGLEPDGCLLRLFEACASVRGCVHAALREEEGRHSTSGIFPSPLGPALTAIDPPPVVFNCDGPQAASICIRPEECDAARTRNLSAVRARGRASAHACAHHSLLRRCCLCPCRFEFGMVRPESQHIRLRGESSKWIEMRNTCTNHCSGVKWIESRNELRRTVVAFAPAPPAAPPAPPAPAIDGAIFASGAWVAPCASGWGALVGFPEETTGCSRAGAGACQRGPFQRGGKRGDHSWMLVSDQSAPVLPPGAVKCGHARSPWPGRGARAPSLWERTPRASATVGGEALRS